MKKLGALFLAAPFFLSGCENKFASIPDNELADSMYECRTVQDQAPGMAIRCDNVRRECERRRDEGRYVC